jgi:general secretion pathway protein G
MRPRGFTLIELLVVLAIVSSLLLLVAPRYFGRVDQAKEAVLRENLRTTRAVLDQFYGDIGRYPESLEELVDRSYLRSLPYDPVAESTQAWTLVPAPEGFEGTVYDLRSGAAGVGMDGRNYAEW